MNKIFSINVENDYLICYIFGVKITFHHKANNSIYVIDEYGKKKKVKKIKGLKIIFSRSNSSVTVYKPFIKFKNSKISLNENCHIVIKNNTDNSLNGLIGVNIEMHQNSKVEIGENFYNAYSYYLMAKNSSITIGNNCMFSSGINFLCGDAHKIIDKNTGEIISNNSSHLIIEDSVWIGLNSMLLKNAHISKGSIVAASSVVTRKFHEKNVVIAGNPAQIVKNCIEWEK